MDRADLERLDRETLIAHAETAGVSRARILTRPELVDELLLRRAEAGDKSAIRARGFFGRARDLLARVIELGLNLPDAAEKVRGSAPPPPLRQASAALPTVTLAEIYAAQGHKGRAVETLRRILEHEPEHAVARALLAQLESTPTVAPPRPVPAEVDDALTKLEFRGAAEPSGMLDDEPLPDRYDVDECVAIAVDPQTLFVYWEVRAQTFDHLRATRPGGTIALRFLVIAPTWDGPRSFVRDHDVHATLGDWFVRQLPEGCIVRTAIGWRDGQAFVPIAHSPALETPPDAPAAELADVLARWTPQGKVPVQSTDPDAAAIARALAMVRRHIERVEMSEQGAQVGPDGRLRSKTDDAPERGTGALGSSEESARL